VYRAGVTNAGGPINYHAVHDFSKEDVVWCSVNVKKKKINK
jgi:hypothetical protein